MNKFRGIQTIEIASGQSPVKPVQMGMDGGFRGDVSPRQLQPDESPEMNDIRFERTAIRRDFGWTQIGTSAAFVVLGILEHKFIDAKQSFRRLIRVTRDGGNNAVLEAWDGAAWITLNTSVETIQAVYLAMLSAQGCVYIADGTVLLEWCEIQTKIPQEDDFPASNSLTVALEQTTAVIDPGDAAILDFEINYDVEIFSSPSQDTTVVLEFRHGGITLGERTFVASQFDTFPVQSLNQVFAFTRQIPLNDTVLIRVKSAVGGGNTIELDFLTTLGVPDFSGLKTPPTQIAIDDKYKFVYSITGIAGSATVGFYVDNGSGFVLQTTVVHIVDDPAAEFILTFPDFTDPAAAFGLNLEAGTGTLLENGVEWTRTNVDFSVHGHNAAVNGDTPAGVTYETLGAVVSQFQQIDPGPGGRFLAHFARRLVVLRDDGDTQSLAWSRDGILTDFTGFGSGQSFLVETRSDPLDNLMGAAVIGSNFMALFRQRSINRVFETGNDLLALGALSWIENLGTNCPFSIREVPGGAMFLGHDNMMYYLTESGGPQPVGLPIHQTLIETLTSNLDLVDSAWDSTFGEYILGIPVSGASTITLLWIFDFERFRQTGDIVWRKRPAIVQRFASANVSLVD